MRMHKKRIARYGTALICAFGVALSSMPVYACLLYTSDTWAKICHEVPELAWRIGGWKHGTSNRKSVSEMAEQAVGVN